MRDEVLKDMFENASKNLFWVVLWYHDQKIFPINENIKLFNELI